MTPDDKQAFAEIVTGFAELKGKSLSTAALKIYWNSMQHWEIAAFREAANQLLRTCEFMPTPKDFEDLRKAGRPTAGEAWTEVLNYVRKGFVYWDAGRPTPNAAVQKPASPLTDRAVAAIGGYQAIAMSETDKTHFLERRFAEHYEAMQDADEVREALPQVAFSERPKLNGPQRLLG